MIKKILVAGIFLLGTAQWGLAASPAPDNASAYIISPQDGDTVTSPVTIRFGLTGMGVAPAGTDRAGTGHHHLLIDVDGLPDPALPVPADEHHRHFGGGQTETSLELEPGQHSLQLLLGDWMHVPHLPAVTSDKIVITVR